MIWLMLAWTVFLGMFGERWRVLVCGAGPRGHVDGGTERTVRNREGVERVGGVRPKYMGHK